MQNLEYSVCLPPGWLVSSKANCQASSMLCILKSINAKRGVSFVCHKTLFFLVMNHWKHLSCRLWVFMLFIFWCRYIRKYTLSDEARAFQMTVSRFSATIEISWAKNFRYTPADEWSLRICPCWRRSCGHINIDFRVFLRSFIFSIHCRMHHVAL